MNPYKYVASFGLAALLGLGIAFAVVLSRSPDCPDIAIMEESLDSLDSLEVTIRAHIFWDTHGRQIRMDALRRRIPEEVDISNESGQN